MIGALCPPMRVKWSQRWSFASCRRSVAATCPPVVELFPHFEVEERLGRDDAIECADPVGELEQLGAVRRDDLARRSRRLDANERLLKAKSEGVRDADDLEDPLTRQPSVAGADCRLRNA